MVVGAVMLSSKMVPVAVVVPSVALTGVLMATLKASDCSKITSSYAVTVMTGALVEPAGIWTVTPVVKKLVISAVVLKVTTVPLTSV